MQATGSTLIALSHALSARTQLSIALSASRLWRSIKTHPAMRGSAWTVAQKVFTKKSRLMRKMSTTSAQNATFLAKAVSRLMGTPSSVFFVIPTLL
jgi:hypothetical protein